MITFSPLSRHNLELLKTWLNEPHVNQWYGHQKSWNDEMVHHKYAPRIDAHEEIYCYIASQHKQPFGYIQWYPLTVALPEELPADHEFFTTHPARECAGIDCFIGNPEFLGKGLGQGMITQFCDEFLYPTFKYIIVDPTIDNIRAIRCFYRCGFKYYDECKQSDHCIMIKYHHDDQSSPL